jgi:hypothetical protein
MRKDLTVTHNTLISAVLASAGVPERPPAALGRTSWLDVQTVGQLSAALRGQATPQRGDAANSTASTAPVFPFLSLIDRLMVGPGGLRQSLTAANTMHAGGGSDHQIHAGGGSDRQMDRQVLLSSLAKLQSEKAQWKADWQWEVLQRQKNERKRAKLTALAAAIAALVKALQEAIRRGDLVTGAVLILILARLQAEFDKETARPAE